MQPTLLKTRLLPQLAGLVRRGREAHRRSSETWIRRMEVPRVRKDLMD